MFAKHSYLFVLLTTCRGSTDQLRVQGIKYYTNLENQGVQLLKMVQLRGIGPQDPSKRHPWPTWGLTAFL